MQPAPLTTGDRTARDIYFTANVHYFISVSVCIVMQCWCMLIVSCCVLEIALFVAVAVVSDCGDVINRPVATFRNEEAVPSSFLVV